MKIVRPPAKIDVAGRAFAIFLGGSTWTNWRKGVWRHLRYRYKGIDGVVIDPVRDDWRSTWPDSGDSDYVDQVRWEHGGIDVADIVVVNFGHVFAMLSMVELGIALRKEFGEVLIGCEPGHPTRGYFETLARLYSNVWLACDGHIAPVLDNIIDMFLEDIG